VIGPSPARGVASRALRPDPTSAVPAETVRVARAAFPKGHPYLRLRDALVTVLQFAEGLPDRQTADAVRDRLNASNVGGIIGVGGPCP
jgi:transposase